MAGLAGLGAAAALKLSGADKAHAANGGPITLGLIGTEAHNPTSETRVVATTPFAAPLLQIINGGSPFTQQAAIAGTANAFGAFGVYGSASSGTGVHGTGPSGVAGFGSSVGVNGTATANSGTGVNGSAPLYGVRGVATFASGLGVRGDNFNNGNGVEGNSNASNPNNSGDGSGIGVLGRSGTGAGVEGRAIGAGIGVRGVGRSNATGVKGVSNNPASQPSADGDGSGIGVQGKSTGGPGVEGISVNSLGVRGVSTNFTAMVGISTSGHGLYGSTSSASAAGFVGENLAGGLAGYFAGNVFVTGSLQVAGAKNAVIKMQDGTMGSVYCQESPEPYFEDFGKAQLVNGVANVPLEREFASLIAGGEYMVFPVPEGDTRGLFVSRKGPGGFEVREQQGGTSSVPFTYRIVTKRKDVEGRRFARVTDTVGPNLAASRAALGVTGTPPVNHPPPTPVTPPPLAPQPNPPVPNPTQPSPQAPDGPAPGSLIRPQ